MHASPPPMFRALFPLFTMLVPITLSHAQVSVDATQTALASGKCSNTFVKHPLEHTTRAHGPEVTFYDSNGAGVGAGDLDDDGDIDLVLANLNGKNTIFWNEGGLSFRKEALEYGDSRAVSLVDVNGDGLLDVVFTQSLGAPSYWKNVGGAFERGVLHGVTRKAYTFVWDDLDADGDVDLVTASYDSLLEKDLRDTFLFSRGAGVFFFENTPEGFLETRLADRSQALALALFDLDEDGRRDIVVGNDFETPDYAFLNTNGGWTQAFPFAATARNTMSFDVGDVDNDGVLELFATDMKPDFGDLSAVAAWMPLMDRSYHRQTHDDPQREENVLQRRTPKGFENIAYGLGLDATGWSWSGRFGDLDRNGFLDLYIVNGMIAKDVFGHLPQNELVEENQVYKNDGGNRFSRADWGLGAAESGRGMTMADLDGDGDLDIIVNNLETPAVLFENRLCGGSSLEVDLRWPASRNTRALGARLTLHTSAGSLYREVRAAGGYLSGEVSRVHFGLPEDNVIEFLEVIWPDGERTILEATPDTLLVLTRGAP